LLGTFDTKGREYGYVRDRVREQGVDVILVDAGILGEPLVSSDVSRDEVARAGGTTVQELATVGDRGNAVDAMAQGASEIIARLHAEGRLHGLLGLGGSGGSTLVSAAMRRLPVGVPKLLVSTVAAGDTRPYVGNADITMMYPVVDISGINRISEQILSNAAAAIAGMAQKASSFKPTLTSRPLIGATMFGVTTPCVTTARERLEALGYEVLVFHATGAGGDAMETLVRDGFISAVIDITTTELADELAGGICAAGPQRLEVAGSRGIPQVVSLGALDMVNFGPMKSVPSHFRHRRLHKHNASITLMRTTAEECAELGLRMARKLNSARGSVILFIPLRGFSAVSTKGQIFYDPEADGALISALREHIEPHVEIREVDTDINDPAFARSLADSLHQLCKASKGRESEESH
jgi:uncharacterized protein (UPF0261 family)